MGSGHCFINGWTGGSFLLICIRCGREYERAARGSGFLCNHGDGGRVDLLAPEEEVNGDIPGSHDMRFNEVL